jgi:hypothetical protein
MAISGDFVKLEFASVSSRLTRIQYHRVAIAA